MQARRRGRGRSSQSRCESRWFREESDHAHRDRARDRAARPGLPLETRVRVSDGRSCTWCQYMPGGNRWTGAPGAALRRTARACTEPRSASGSRLHERGLVYRDLKARTSLDAEGHVRITDFGLARASDPDASGGTKTFCGTPGLAQAPSGHWARLRGRLVVLRHLLFEMMCGVPRLTQRPGDVREDPLGTAALPSTPLQSACLCLGISRLDVAPLLRFLAPHSVDSGGAPRARGLAQTVSERAPRLGRGSFR